eukprot:5508393-Alexandrium_andersonii.AAC.1
MKFRSGRETGKQVPVGDSAGRSQDRRLACLRGLNRSCETLAARGGILALSLIHISEPTRLALI